jgi:hypothetical protein
MEENAPFRVLSMIILKPTDLSMMLPVATEIIPTWLEV